MDQSKTKLGTRVKGRRAEVIAERYLIAKGYKLVAKNWLASFGEIDLIMKDKGWLVFVEVKSKRGQGFGGPEGLITLAKKSRIRRLSESYMVENEITGKPVRIDVVTVDFAGQPIINHYENAF